MLPDRVSNPGPLTYESGALPIALRGPAAEGRWGEGFFTSRGWGSFTWKGGTLHIISIILLYHTLILSIQFPYILSDKISSCFATHLKLISRYILVSSFIAVLMVQPKLTTKQKKTYIMSFCSHIS